jgi:hypothetical protein
VTAVTSIASRSTPVRGRLFVLEVLVGEVLVPEVLAALPVGLGVVVVFATTTTVPCMNGWIEQMYAYVPACVNVCDPL